MRRQVRLLPLLILLGASLVPGLSQVAVGQEYRGTTELNENVSSDLLIEDVTLELDARRGLVLKPGEDFGTLLAERLRVTSSADGKPIQVGLWVEAFSRKEGSLGRFDGAPIDIESGRTYPGKAWIQNPDQVNEFAAPGFGDRRKEGLMVQQVVVINHEEQYVVINHEEQYWLTADRTSKNSIVFPDVCKDAPYALVIGVSAPELKGSPSTPKCVVCMADDR